MPFHTFYIINFVSIFTSDGSDRIPQNCNDATVPSTERTTGENVPLNELLRQKNNKSPDFVNSSEGVCSSASEENASPVPAIQSKDMNASDAVTEDSDSSIEKR